MNKRPESSKNAYSECKKRKHCAKIVYWPGRSAGRDIWKLRDKDACRFANIENRQCILYKKELNTPKSETRLERWSWGGSGCERGENSCTILIKVWENQMISK